MDNIIKLNRDLVSKQYKHSAYKSFNISDPKPRNIHKASVKDRLLHHAVHRRLYSYFDKKFIYDSYSCRVGKGQHKAVDRFRRFAWIVSKNHHRTVWVLKCDIRKFFASIDHQTLKSILSKHLDPDTRWLLSQIINSFHTQMSHGSFSNKGLPLGNLTSQLLVNIYMNEFDQFVKRGLKVKHYIRFADDFLVILNDKEELKNILFEMSRFLSKKLKLKLHPDKVFIKTFYSGVDFLGWVNFSDHRVVRTTTRKRIVKGIFKENAKQESIASYLGILEHGNADKLKQELSRNNSSTH